MNENIFEIFTEYALNERLDTVVLQNEEYQKLQSEIDAMIEKIDNLGLSEEQRLFVDRLVSSHTSSGCCYGKIAYQQGIKDCVSLLKEMKLIQ